MRLLWISKLHDTGCTSGDAIFDQKLKAALRLHCEVVSVSLQRRRLRPIHRAWSMIWGRPYDRLELQLGDNAELFSGFDTTNFDAMIVSHEACDWVADLLPLPAVLICHNVTSRVMDQVLTHPVARLLARGIYRRYESNLLRRIDRRASVVALSSNDAAALEEHLSNPVTVVLPGVPDARIPILKGVAPVLNAVGSQEWAPKRRDMARFLRAWGGKPRSVKLDTTRAFINREVHHTPVTFGLVADRFDAGFKLKIGEYIVNGVVPIAMVDVYRDLRNLPFSSEFLVVAADADDAEQKILSATSRWDDATTSRFLAFREAAMASMTWADAGVSILSAAGNAVRRS
jgi:hypothetical protein